MVKYYHDGRALSDAELNALIEPVKTGKTAKEFRIAEALRLVEGPKILDVGCSMGYLDYLIAERHPSWQVYGIDVLKESIKLANDKFKLPNTRYETRDVLKKKFKPNSFDCVLFLETIEHVDVPGVFLEEFHRILKPNGFLIISTPNAVSLLNLFRHFGQNVGKRLSEINKEPRHTGTNLEHVASYDVFTLARLLERNKFAYVTHAYAELFLPLSRHKYANLSFMRHFLKPLCNDLIIKARKK